MICSLHKVLRGSTGVHALVYMRIYCMMCRMMLNDEIDNTFTQDRANTSTHTATFLAPTTPDLSAAEGGALVDRHRSAAVGAPFVPTSCWSKLTFRAAPTVRPKKRESAALPSALHLFFVTTPADASRPSRPPAIVAEALFEPTTTTSPDQRRGPVRDKHIGACLF